MVVVGEKDTSQNEQYRKHYRYLRQLGGDLKGLDRR